VRGIASAAALQPNPTSSASVILSQAHEAQAAALAASVKALEQLLASQRSGSTWRTVLVVAAPLVAGCVLRYVGWQHFGWVSLEQLQTGLASVREAVGTAIHELGETIRLRFERVDVQLASTAQSLQEVSQTTEDLRVDLRAVGEAIQAVEERMSPIEANAATAAQGVEVLCELVKTSGLLSNASADSLRRLDTFTGVPPVAGEPAPPPPRELLPPYGTAGFDQAAPPFVRALMANSTPTTSVPAS